jgi:4-amino-4-deoxy-L-arabinose transferase-like glycosyltransferase/tetratricopeptide (TPR) repeat protein
METQPENLKKSWISEHPHIVIGFILAACLGPFVDKAIHVDDPLFVWTAEWIQKHPADFFGSEVNWFGSATPMWVANCNPPLMSYFLAAVASVFGWNEIVLHLACLAVAFTAAAGIYALAKMWCGRPLLAAVVAIFTPVFLVSSSTLMCDVLMLAFWIWALVLWERALAREQCWWQFVLAGVLAGLAMLTKYSAVTLLPLLPSLSILRTRKLGWGWLGVAVPLMMLAGYEWMTFRMSGEGLFLAAMHYAQTSRSLSADWKAGDIMGLAFAGGSLLPLLFFAPFLWRRQALLAGGLAVFGLVLGTFCLVDHLWLVRSWDDPQLMNHWGFVLQLTLLTAAGLHLLLLTAADVWQRRDTISTTLGLWIMSGFLFASVLNWTVSARSFLPLAPAVAILLVRRLDAIRGNFMAGGWMMWPLIPSAAITLGLVMADYRVADSARTAAQQIAAQYTPPNHKLWFEGHWGFQYYLEKLGGRPLDVARALLQPGDVVVVPWDNSNFMPLPPGSVGWVNDLQYSPGSWINLSVASASESGGFYSSVIAPVPFAVGKVAPHFYCIVRVLSKVQFNTQFANPRETLKGALLAAAPISCSVEPEPGYPVKPAVAGEMRLANRSQMDGDIQEAIQHYRKALDMDSNDPVVLNNLAWILATAAKPGLRNGQEAVRLATRAVELTDSRWPLFIGTLAAARAQAGQFPEAVKMAAVASHLAQVTGQTEVAMKNARLCGLYAAGKTVDASGDP